jgi:hypothetical protein
MVHKINAAKLYYLNLLGRLMLCPLLVALGGKAGFGSELNPPTPDAQPSGCLIAC